MHLPITGKISRIILISITISLVFPSIKCFCNVYQDGDSIYKKEIILKAEDLIRGERLFYGLVYIGDKSVNCAGCHNTRATDTLNWNPDAWEISKKYKSKSYSEFGNYVRKYNISPEDAIMIKGYLDIFADQGLKPDKPVVTNLFLFILACLLLLFSTTDLIITKKVKPVWIHLAILTITGAFITYRLVTDSLDVGHSKGYSPDQPVKFSHAVHSGQNTTECLYCHSGAEYSKSSGFPALNVCMNCHLVVRKGTRSGSFEINKLIEAFENKQSIKWIRIFSLPDHAFFSHAQHVSIGKIECQVCHGPVEQMDRIEMKNKMTMGWCINCHRERKIDMESNVYYTEYKNLFKRLNSGEIDSVTVENTGGINCMKCHY